jgi:glycosyltransferase involved in cell wall biosynthesis
VRDSVLIVNWGMRFLRGGGESSVEAIYNVYRQQNPQMNVEILSAKFSYGRHYLQDRDKDFSLKLIPTIVFYWSSCESSFTIITWIKRLLKWGSLFIFEIFAVFFALIRHKKSLIICSDLFFCYFLLGRLLPSANVVLRLHGPVKSKIHRSLVSQANSNIISNGIDDLPKELDMKRVVRLTPPLPSAFYASQFEIELKWTSAELHVVFAGRLEMIKGVDRIAEYVCSLSSRFNIKRLTICGDGSMRNEIDIQQKLLRNLGIELIYYEQRTRMQVAEILKKAHLVLLPSRQDFSPNVVREALAAGCIVVVSSEISSQFNQTPNIFAIDQMLKIKSAPIFNMITANSNDEIFNRWVEFLKY